MQQRASAKECSGSLPPGSWKEKTARRNIYQTSPTQKALINNICANFAALMQLSEGLETGNISSIGGAKFSMAYGMLAAGETMQLAPINHDE